MANLHMVYGPELTVVGSKRVTHQKPSYVRDLAVKHGAVEHTLFRKASKGELYLVHSVDYIDGVLEGTTLNGFDNNDPLVTEQARWASGAMVHGVQIALEKGNCLVPASGFHHASYDHGWGFCTFNGMMLAAVLSSKKTLIIDGDAHWGDGCINIIEELKLQDIVHYRQSFNPEEGLLQIKDYELVIYQPGADSVESDDPKISFGNFIKRDMNVFSTCKAFNVPVLVCLGGGYDSLASVVKTHHQTVIAMAGTYLTDSHPEALDDMIQV